MVRTATEVEARAAALGPGGGAVVVGMTRESPWRGRVVYRDLVRSVGGVEVSHPQVLLDAIRAAEPESSLQLELVREGAILSVDAPLSRRERETKRFSIPILFSFERERDTSSTSILMGLFSLSRTDAAWRMRLLWVITWSRGDADRLEAVER